MNNISHSQLLSTTQKQSQQLTITLAMQQAFSVLQMPILELSQWLEEQIEQNPLLEKKDPEEKIELSQHQLGDTDNVSTEEPNSPHHRMMARQSRQIQERLYYEKSLYQHLLYQAEQMFKEEKDLALALQIIGNLDDRGFLSSLPDEVISKVTPREMQRILSIVQQFDPPGIAAKDLRESLLIQLQLQNREKSLSYQIVNDHWEELLPYNLREIEKHYPYSAEEIDVLLKRELSLLDFYPGYRFCAGHNHNIIPDITIEKRDNIWKIQINNDFLPTFHLSQRYAQIFPSCKMQEKLCIRKYVREARWMRRIVNRRSETLLQITKYVLKKQNSFFEGDSLALSPMTMQEVANHLMMHESSVARAVSGKYLSTPSGIFSLRDLFTGSASKTQNTHSSYTAKKLLRKLISEENKKKPLSDGSLEKQLHALGYSLSRRTITKYRKNMQISSATKRKRWNL